MKRLRSSRFTMSAALAAAMLLVSATPAAAREGVPDTAPVQDDSKFVTLYPGVYTEKEAKLVAAYFAANEALRKRGPVDVQALIAGRLPAGTPGVGPVVHATPEWVKYNNLKYDPESRLRTDAAYARSLGFADVLAYPTFGANDDIFRRYR